MKHNYNFPAGVKAAVFSGLLFTLNVEAQTLDANKLENVHYSKDAGNLIVTNDIMVSGTVVDASDQSPLPKASVLLKGTETGTITDDSGHFNFPKPLQENDVLVFSFVGYQPFEHTVTANDRDREISIALQFRMDILGEAAQDGEYEQHHGIRGWLKKMRKGM